MHPLRDLEPKICDLVHLSRLGTEYIEEQLNDHAAHAKALGVDPEKYTVISNEDAETILNAVYRMEREIGELKTAFYEKATEGKIPPPDGDPLRGAAANQMREAWRTIMGEFAGGLKFREMSIAYDILRSVGDELRDVCDGTLAGTRGGDLIEVIQEEIAHVRRDIGAYCMNVADFTPGTPADEQNFCDAVALCEASYDVGGHAELIATIGNRLVARNKPATAKAA